MPLVNIDNLSGIDKLAHQSCTSPLNNLPAPTKEQKLSGDYAKGHLTVLGLPVAIENPTGSIRSGVDPNGLAWSIEMSNHYGYIEKTKGADGEEVDVFLKNGMSPDFNGDIYVIHQVNEDGSFDEHKVVIGASDPKDATDIYMSNYSKGWTGLGKMVRYSIPDFKEKFLSRWGDESSETDMNDNKMVATAAVKVDPEKFTWMKYKGAKAKILTHTKRNGDVIKARLEPNDVFGYREVRQRSTGKDLVQIVLKSDGMDLAYNLTPKSFNTHVLKVSRSTVMPKMFRKAIVVDTIDKNPKVKVAEPKAKAPAKTKVSPKAKESKVKMVAPSTDTPTVSPEVKPSADKAVDLGNVVANAINGKQLSKGIYSTFKADSGHLEVADVDGVFVVSAVFNNTKYFDDGSKVADLEAKLRDTSLQEFHSLIDSKSAAAIVFDNINGNYDPLRDTKGLPVKVRRTINRSTGERRIRIPLFEILNKDADVSEVDTNQIPVNEDVDTSTVDMVEDETISIQDVRDRLKESFNVAISDKNIDSLQILANEYGVTYAELIADLVSIAEDTPTSLVRALTTFRQGHNSVVRTKTESSVKLKPNRGLSFTVSARASGVIRFKINNVKVDIPYADWASALKSVSNCPISVTDLEDYFSTGEVSELLELSLSRLEKFAGISSNLLLELAERDCLLQVYSYVLGLIDDDAISAALRSCNYLIEPVLRLKTL